jgi:hypothetical protein
MRPLRGNSQDYCQQTSNGDDPYFFTTTIFSTERASKLRPACLPRGPTNLSKKLVLACRDAEVRLLLHRPRPRTASQAKSPATRAGLIGNIFQVRQCTE